MWIWNLSGSINSCGLHQSSADDLMSRPNKRYTYTRDLDLRIAMKFSNYKKDRLYQLKQLKQFTSLQLNNFGDNWPKKEIKVIVNMLCIYIHLIYRLYIISLKTKPLEKRVKEEFCKQTIDLRGAKTRKILDASIWY